MMILAYCTGLVNSFIKWKHNQIIRIKLSVWWSKKYASVSFIIQLIYHVIIVFLVKSSGFINWLHATERNKEIWIFCKSIFHCNFPKFRVPYFMHILSHAYTMFNPCCFHPLHQLINIRIFWN